MRYQCLDEKWTFRRGLLDSLAILQSDPGETVNLPHDGMIGTPVTPDAPAEADMGYFTGDLTNYTKYVRIPEEWKGGCVGLKIDGAMMNAAVEINGYKVGLQHYGYAPFYVDLTDYVTFGADNRITINVNTSMQPNSRWYTGSGLFRGVKLCRGAQSTYCSGWCVCTDQGSGRWICVSGGSGGGAEYHPGKPACGSDGVGVQRGGGHSFCKNEACDPDQCREGRNGETQSDAGTAASVGCGASGTVQGKSGGSKPWCLQNSFCEGRDHGNG